MELEHKDLDNFKVRKSNDLIEAKFKLPLIEQRILALCIAQINPKKDHLDNPYKFTVKEYCERTGLDHRGMHQTLRNAVDKLKTRNLYKYDPDLKRERIYGWIDKADVCDNGRIDIYLHHELASDLLAKKRYAEYALRNSFNFNSKYTLRFFELFQSWSYLGRKQIEINNLREMIGIEENEYPRYTDFKKRVLGKAISEINVETDLNIEINEFRKKRKVSIVEFEISKTVPSLKKTKEIEEEINKSNQVDMDEWLNPNEEDKWIEKLSKYGIGASATLRLIKEFGIDKIEKSIAKVISDQKEGKISEKVNLAGVVINKIKDPEPEELPSGPISSTDDLKKKRSDLMNWFQGFDESYNPYNNESGWVAIEIDGKIINFMNENFKDEVEKALEKRKLKSGKMS